MLPWVSNLQFIHGARSFLEAFLSFPSLLIPGNSLLAVHCSWKFPPCLFCQLYLRQATVPSPQGPDHMQLSSIVFVSRVHLHIIINSGSSALEVQGIQEIS